MREGIMTSYLPSLTLTLLLTAALPRKVDGGVKVPSGTNPKALQPACCHDWHKWSKTAVAMIDASGSIKAADDSDINYHVQGQVTLTYINRYMTRIQAEIKGIGVFLPSSKVFAMHVHEYGITQPSCLNTGSHYNPCDKDHSNDPLTQNRHVGDIIRLEVTDPYTDTLSINRIDYQVKLIGPLTVLGRSIVIHAGSPRIACAPIVIPQPAA